MIIDRSKHNKFVAKPTYLGTTTNTSESTSGVTNVFVTGGSGGSGLSAELLDKLNNIEYGALVNLDAYSYINLSTTDKEGTTTVVLEARIQTDTADIIINGSDTVKVLLTENRGIDNKVVQSTGVNTSSWSFNYSKVEKEVPNDTDDETTIVTTYPFTMTYTSGDKVKTTDFDTISLYSRGTIVKSYTQELVEIDGNSDGINSITIDEEGLYFDHVYFTISKLEEDQYQPTVTNVCIFAVLVTVTGIYTLTGSDSYWILDEDHDAIYTKYNVYSMLEVSAYGYRKEEETNVERLDDLLDVTLTNPSDGDILYFNGTIWINKPGKEIGSVNPDDIKAGTNIQIEVNGNTITINNTYKLPIASNDVLGGIKISTANDSKLLDPIFKVSEDGTLSLTDTLKDKLLLLFDLLDMFEWDKSESATDKTLWRIKAKRSLWSIGEVSAYGKDEDSLAPQGAEYLYQLKDVNNGKGIVPSSSDTLLMWDGSTWLYINKNQVGLNETELNNYLTTNNYLKDPIKWLNINSTTLPTTLSGYGITDAYTKLETDDRYVNIIGDTMTGNLILPAALASDYIQVGDVKLMYDATNHALYVKFKDDTQVANFYSEGEVSAYGIKQEGTPSGALYLYELLDVDAEDAENNDMLVYSSSSNTWITIPMSLVKPDLTDYLTADKGKELFYTKELADGRYVTIATELIITGAKTFTEGIKLNLGNLTYNQEGIEYRNSGSIVGSIGSVHDGSLIYYILLNPNGVLDGIGGLVVGDELGFNGYQVYHSGNVTIPKEPDLTKYVLKHGDTMTGNLIVTKGSGKVTIDVDGCIELLGNSPYIRIGNIYLKYDDTNHAIYTLYINDTLSANFYALGEVSAYGVGNTSSGGMDVELMWSLLADSTNEQINKSHLTTALSGYATQTWVLEYVESNVPEVTWSNIGGKPSWLSSTVGSTNSPVYISNGTPTPITYDLNATLNSGSSGKIAYYSSGTAIDDYTSTIGSETRLWYLNAGVPTNSTSNVGSSTSPVYLSNGTITAVSYDLNANVNSGSSGRLAYYSSSTSIDDYPSSVGSSTRLWYLSSGQPTNSTSNVGGSSTPIYMSNGSFYSCSGILTTSNYSSTLDGRYVNVTGDTMSGDLVVNADIHANDVLYAVDDDFVVSSNPANISSSNSVAIRAYYTNPYIRFVEGGYTYYVLGYNSRLYFGPSSSTAPYVNSSGLIGVQVTGSSPFIVNSSVLVENLNADLLDGFDTKPYGENQGIPVHWFFGSQGATTKYIKVGELPSVSVTGAGVSHVTFEIAGAYNFASNARNYAIVTAGTRGSIEIFINMLFGSIYLLSIGYVSSGSKVEIWVGNKDSYTSATTIRIINSLNFTGSLTELISRPSGFVEVSPRYYFDPSGNFLAVGEVTAYSTSDRRLKSNLILLLALDKLRSVDVYEYDWNDTAMQLRSKRNVHDYGIIAQELLAVIPEAVTYNMYDKGYMGIDYTKLIPFAIQAVKEVDDEVTKLKSRVKVLEDKLSKYEYVD